MFLIDPSRTFIIGILLSPSMVTTVITLRGLIVRFLAFRHLIRSVAEVGFCMQEINCFLLHRHPRHKRTVKSTRFKGVPLKRVAQKIVIGARAIGFYAPKQARVRARSTLGQSTRRRRLFPCKTLSRFLCNGHNLLWLRLPICCKRT